MKNLIVAGLAAFAISATGWAQTGSRDIPVESFDRIDAGGNFQLHFQPGETYSLRIEGDPDDIEDLRIDVRNGELSLRQDRGILRWFGSYRDLDIDVYVTGPGVDDFEFSRGLNANITELSGGDYTVNVSTGSYAAFAGSCDFANVNVSTGSDMDGGNLECTRVRVNASTGSSMVVNAIESLTANVSTGADVRSVTEPADLRVNTSTGGDVSVGSRR